MKYWEQFSNEELMSMQGVELDEDDEICVGDYVDEEEEVLNILKRPMCRRCGDIGCNSCLGLSY